MKVSLVLAHPRAGSFNHAIAEKARETLLALNHSVDWQDLYADSFDPLITAREMMEKESANPLVRRYQEQVIVADGIIIVHPNWWGQPPAILKGWIDRVLQYDVAFRFEPAEGDGGLPTGLLQGKKAVVFNTSNTPDDREREAFGDPLDTIWHNCIFGFCGIEQVKRRMFSVICDADPQRLRGWLDEVGGIVKSQFPET